MGLRERLLELLDGGAQRRRIDAELTDLRALVTDATRREVTAESLRRAVAEDDQLLDLIMRSRFYEPLYGGLADELSDTERWQAVRYSRQLTLRDLTQRRVVRMWTDFGFGIQVQVEPVDPQARPAWDEFWTARRNGPVVGPTRLYNLSDALLTDGEIFLFYYISRLDGTTTVRRVPCEQIIAIITDPDDPEIPLYYVRSEDDGSVYYPDWQATPEQLALVTIPDDARLGEARQTAVVVQHLAYEAYNGRGWPLFYTGWEWVKVYNQFLGDRAAVARKAAMYTEKVTLKGGARSLDAIKAKLESTLASSSQTWERNPPPAAASDWLQNDAVNREWMTRDTGAAGAQTDGMAFMGQVSLSTGVPLHWLGRPDAMQNRATARESALPWIAQIQRYQLFWSEAFSDMCELVLRAVSAYAPGRPEFASYDALVNLEAPPDLQTEDLTPVIGAVSQAVAAGAVDPALAQRVNAALLRQALVAVGIRDTEAVLSPQVAPEQTSAEADGSHGHTVIVRPDICPLCGATPTWEFADHGLTGGLRYCPQCRKTFDALVETRRGGYA